MKIIYIVTSGSYSGYGIDAVFDSKNKAQEYIDYYDRASGLHLDDPNIEEWELNAYHYDKISKGLVIYIVKFDDIGESAGHALTIYPNDGRLEGHSHNTNPVQYWTHVWAKSEEAALKIANERRARYLASGKVEQL